MCVGGVGQVVYCVSPSTAKKKKAGCITLYTFLMHRPKQLELNVPNIPVEIRYGW
jgi:hypothetical protein